jgi:hypothetical protein
MNSREILKNMNSCFKDTTQLEASLTNFLRYTTDILALYASLKRLGKINPDHITNLMENYKNRFDSFLSILKKCGSGELANENTDEILILCYDELLILYILAFSIYDSVYDLIDYTFRQYLFNKKLLSESIIDLNIMTIIKQSTLFSSYEFPIIISMSLRSNNELKLYFAEKNRIEETKIEKEIFEFTESLICLMSYRNQVGHMSADLELFSVKKIEKNYEKISLFVTIYQKNLEKLMLLINNLTQDLIRAGQIVEKKK